MADRWGRARRRAIGEGRGAHRVGVGLRAALAVALAAGGLGTGPTGAAPAGAQPSPGLVVSGNEELGDYSSVGVTVDAPGEALVQCDARVVADPSPDAVRQYCGNELALPGPQRPGAA